MKSSLFSIPDYQTFYNTISGRVQNIEQNNFASIKHDITKIIEEWYVTYSLNFQSVLGIPMWFEILLANSSLIFFWWSILKKKMLIFRSCMSFIYVFWAFYDLKKWKLLSSLLMTYFYLMTKSYIQQGRNSLENTRISFFVNMHFYQLYVFTNFYGSWNPI